MNTLNISDKIPFFKKFLTGESRTILIKKNIIGSSILKGISILVSFLLVPLTIDFVNPTRYGIWLTLSSLMSWFSFFDIGLTHGFRNKFAEAKALGDTQKAKEYVSTTYASLTILFGSLILIVIPINYFIDWSSILNISDIYRDELRTVFGILIFFFCCTIILQIISTLVIADQRNALSSMIHVAGQILTLIIIFLLTRIYSEGNLSVLALALSGSPVLILIISTIFLFTRKYKEYRPSFANIKFSYVKDILGLGSKFFIITSSMLFIFQLINVIISRNLGPETVSQYNIAYKYFSIVMMIWSIVMAPFWSAFTDAYTKNDYNWMKKMLFRLEKIWLISIPLMIIMLSFSNIFYKYWLHNALTVSFTISIFVALYIIINMRGSLYMALINGIGKLQLQLYIYLIFALLAYPLMNYFCKKWGIPGLLLIPSIVYLIQAISGQIQIHKILNKKCSGIWDK